MILNAYAVLDTFLCILRLILALAMVWLGVAAWRAFRTGFKNADRQAFEDRGHLLFLITFISLGLNVASWPMFYLLLQSYVPEWPGVMCIYGVTQIGTGSMGISRFLPGLVRLVQVLKPILVFAGGTWFVLYLLNRRTRTAPLAGRILLLLIAVGVLAAGDAVAETAYLAISKKEETASAGCCTLAFDGPASASRFVPRVWIGEGYRRWLYVGYYGLNIGTALAIFGLLRFGSRDVAFRWWAAPLAMLVSLSVAFNALFLVEVAAPALLHLPFHHCPYDLVPDAPESLAAIALFFLGAFAVGWACLAWWLGRNRETEPFVPGLVIRLLNLGLFGYLASLVMMSLELALAWAKG